MKVAILCAFVFGVISVAASSSQTLSDEHHLRPSDRRGSTASAQRRDQENVKKTRFKHHLDALLAKRGESGAVAEIGENLAGVLKGAVGGKGSEAAAGHITSFSDAAAHVPHRIPEAHPYPAPSFEPPRYTSHYPAPPPYGHDTTLNAKVDKIGSKLKNLKQTQAEHQKQIMLMEELQAKQMMQADHMAAAAAPPGKLAKKGWGTGALALGVGGGLAAGYGLTKMFDTKPSDSTTGYNQEDLDALKGAGGAAPGTAPVDGAPQGQGVAGGSAADNDIADGPYRIPNSNLIWLTDREGQTHVLDPSQNMAEVAPPQGWQPSGQNGGAAGSGAASGVAPPPSSDGGAGSNGASMGRGASDQQSPAASGAISDTNAGAKTAGGDSTDSSSPDGNSQDGANGVAQPNQSAGGPKPVWDNNVKLWYVTSRKGTKYYIDDQTGYFINSQTGDVSDPKTGQIVYRGDELMNNGNGGDGSIAGQGQARAGGGGSAGAGRSNGGGGASMGGDSGRMQKRSLRHRKIEKRQYPKAAYQAVSPALREQARQAILRGSSPGSSALGAVKKAGMGKTLAKGAVGIGALVALVLGLGAIAHPTRPNTTPDNEYGLVPTDVCDVYGQPIMKDFRGVLWNKSTYSRVDMNDVSSIYSCTAEEMAAAGQGGASALQQKRDLRKQKTPLPAGLIAAVQKDVAHEVATVEHGSAPQPQSTKAIGALEKRQMKAISALLPSMSASGAMAVGGATLITAIYLHSIHQKKLKALQDDYNSRFHSAGEAASSVGNAISTGANGQLFNPLNGNLVMVDQSTNTYYDSGSGEQVNPKTGMPFRYGGGDDSGEGKKVKQQPERLPLDQDGNVSGDSPEVQQAMAQWDRMTPQQQQQLLAQYGGVANQILNSSDPNAALQAWSAQQGQSDRDAPQQQQQQQQYPTERFQSQR